MTPMIRRLGCLAIATTWLTLSYAGAAQETEKKMPHEKHDASLLDDALRNVINTGVKMFNEQQDYAGCHRLFHGSLLTVKPFLPKDLQGKIESGIASAEALPNSSDKAFALRKVLDEIRVTTKANAGAIAKKSDKTEKKDKTEKTVKDPEPPAADKGQIAGKITYDGKPLPGGYFITLVGADGKKFSSAVQKDGAFTFKTPIPAGQYNAAIEPIPDQGAKATPLPARYLSDSTSGIIMSIQPGPNLVDLNLVK
jgi:hypothetical protein